MRHGKIALMSDLQKFDAKKCLTVAGVLIHEGKLLLVKHKKVGFWLSPGGHVEANELPHQAAVREFWEEAGIRVQAKAFGHIVANEKTEYVPSPFSSNLHWVCRDNYEHRTNGKPLTEYAQKHWKKGCEQHFNLLYLMEPTGSLEFTQNMEESDGIGWFTLDEVLALDTAEQIKQEAKYAFKLISHK
jgi:8-oxo-dGTP pyrophosphatase MutT (NUDIX family)